MLKLSTWGATLLVLAGTCLAQAPATLKFYKLDFVVKEVEGNKVLNSRAYFMTVPADKTASGGSIRTSSRMPYQSSTQPNSGQWNFAEVGVNIDCGAVQEIDGDLSMRLTTEVTSPLLTEPGNGPPTIRQNRWMATVLVAPKKPTVVFSSDDPTTKRQMQVELTATPLK
jgi:hypothetical protein